MATSKTKKKQRGSRASGPDMAKRRKTRKTKPRATLSSADAGSLIVQFPPPLAAAPGGNVAAAALAPVGGAGVAAAVAMVSGVSRACVIEGDSWFNYPVPGAIGVDEALRRKHRYTFVRRRFSEAGDTLENMILGSSWPEVKQAIADSQTRVFLFSGGGNDLAGPEFIGFLHHRGLSNTPISEETFELLLDRSFEPCIRRMSQEVQAVSPNTKIFMHGYDYGLPDGKHINLIVRRIGPWLKPSFDIKGWDFAPARAGIARIIDMYNDLLKRLSQQLSNFVYVDLRNTVGANQWANELHPGNAGFEACADKIHAKVVQEVPGW